jgi:hypothetical protein
MLLLAFLFSLSSATAWAAARTASSPSALPGPPPGAGSGFPVAPAAGGMPPAQPLGPAATVPAHVSGPGLLSGTARLQGRQFTLAIACHAGGRVSVTAPAIAGGVLAHASYSCRKGAAVAKLKLSAGHAGRLRALGSTLAGVTLGSQHLSLTLEARTTASSYWSDGGLECSLLGADEPYVVDPNFTVTPSVTIDVRPWLAWYTPANGWRWLGTAGVNSSRWYQWTATTTGVEQWVTPAGAINPWTWAPIQVHPGQNTSAISVFEVVYLYPHPRYVWKYGPSVTSGTTVNTYCSYP